MSQVFTKDNLPVISDEIIRYLKEKYPLEVYNSVKDFGDLRYHQGIQFVITDLALLNERTR